MTAPRSTGALGHAISSSSWWPRLVVVILAAASCSLAACGKRHQPPAATDDDELPAAVETLRFRIATTPSDMRARAALARLELRAGRPGAALREWTLVREYGRLTTDDRQRMAELLLQRARARLQAGDGQAYLDLDAARSLGGQAAPTLALEAHMQAALVELRRSTPWAREAAGRHLERARSLAPADPRLAYLTPDTAQLQDLARAAQWLHEGNAMAEARLLLQQYVARGGRDPTTLWAHVSAVRWWGDGDRRQRMDLHRRRELLALGVSTCAVSRTPDQVGCRDSWEQMASGPDAAGREVRRRAEALAWQLRGAPLSAEATRSWTLLAIRGFLAGEESVPRLLQRRLDLPAALALGEALGRARPLLLRAAGQIQASRSVLDQQLRTLSTLGMDQLGPSERVLLLFEAAAHRHPRTRELLASALSDDYRSQPMPAWAQAALRALAARLPPGAALGARSARSQLPTEKRPERLARRVSMLARLALAHLEDPALGDRVARELVDRYVYPGQLAPAVAGLYVALGDGARALRWRQEVFDVQPRHTAQLEELAAQLAAVGQRDRARQHYLQATADSGDAGATGMRAAAWFLELGRPLDALFMGKRALPLVAPAERRPVFDLMIEAMEQLDRDGEAAELRAHRDRLLPIAGNDPQLTARTERIPLASGAPESLLAELAGRQIGDEQRALLLDALVWNPDHRRLQMAVIEHLDQGDPGRQWLLDRLLAQVALAGTAGHRDHRHALIARHAARTLRAAWGGRRPGQLRRMLQRHLRPQSQ